MDDWPLGDYDFRYWLAVSLLPCLLGGSVTGGDLEGVWCCFHFFCCFQYIFCPKLVCCWLFYSWFKLVVWGFKLGFHVTFVHYSVVFHGHVGPCRIRRLCSDIALVVYIYINVGCCYLCVAGCCWLLLCYCFLCLVLYLKFKWIESANVLQLRPKPW